MATRRVDDPEAGDSSEEVQTWPRTVDKTLVMADRGFPSIHDREERRTTGNA